MTSILDRWGNFLAWEKITVQREVPVEQLLDFIKLLSTRGEPKSKPYKLRLATRRIICETAIDNGIDLTKWKFKGRLTMSRGLLDMWNKVYQERFQSTYGTPGAKEAIRRDVKTKLGKLNIKGVRS